MVKRKIWLVLGILVMFFLTTETKTLALTCNADLYQCKENNLEQWCQDPTTNSLVKNWIWVTVKICEGDQVCDASIKGCRSTSNNDCITSTGDVRKSGEIACGEDINYLYICNNGSWEKGTKCESNVVNTFVCQNNDSSNTASCVRSTSTTNCEGYKCEGKKIYQWCGSTTDGYTWIEKKTCSDSEYCDQNSGTCITNTADSKSCTTTDGKTVKSGETACGENKNTIYTCNNGSFDKGRICDGAMFCVYDSSGVASCAISNEVRDATPVSFDSYNPSCYVDGKLGTNTALGCVPVEIKDFVPWLLTFLFGIAGGIAFLLMAYGFILIATSGGDEKKMAGAKETITSAIIGLLVCIFAIFILRLIAVQILKIPGF